MALTHNAIQSNQERIEWISNSVGEFTTLAKILVEGEYTDEELEHIFILVRTVRKQKLAEEVIER